MLILTRRVGESIVVGDDIVLTVFEVRGDAVRVGIEAPRSVQVHRQEVYEELKRQNEAAASPSSNAIDALSGALGSARKAGSDGANVPASGGANVPASGGANVPASGGATVPASGGATLPSPDGAAPSSDDVAPVRAEAVDDAEPSRPAPRPGPPRPGPR